MSKRRVAFSARLHADNTAEASAIEVLEYFEGAGYTRRQILAMALNNLGGYQVELPQNADALVSEARALVDDLRAALSDVQRGNYVTADRHVEPGRKGGL